MKRLIGCASLALAVLTGCGAGSNATTPKRANVVTLASDVRARSPSESVAEQIELDFKDGRISWLPPRSRIRVAAEYVAFRGTGYSYSYPLASIASGKYVAGGGRRQQSVVQPICFDSSGTCCDPWIGCYTNPTQPPDGPDGGTGTYTVDFRLGGGSEVCQWDLGNGDFDCSIPATPNTGDGWKGNVVKDFTWSAARKEAVLDCNPASIISKTRGAIEYTERRPGQLPAFSVRDTGEVEPNTEVVTHFTPALSANSAVSTLFLFVYPSVGPAASCNAAPPRTI